MPSCEELDILVNEAERLLNEPTNMAVYGFEARALNILSALLQELRRCPPESTRTLPVPTHGFPDDPTTITIPAFKPGGKPLLLLEPHCDDVALSFSGTLLSWKRPIIVLTLFNKSRTIDGNLLGSSSPSYDEISALRRAENESALGIGLAGECLFLDEWEERWPWSPPDQKRVDVLAQRVADLVDLDKVDLVAPFGFSTHPDHYLTRSVAEQLGCRLFWEDIGFFREYARCEEDRAYGLSQWPGTYQHDLVSLDGHALIKMALLMIYRSQIYPPIRAMSVLRYHWAVARRNSTASGVVRQPRYAECVYYRD
jgi:LmbE family N-acetylglucosaminyl deacetylase